MVTLWIRTTDNHFSDSKRYALGEAFDAFRLIELPAKNRAETTRRGYAYGLAELLRRVAPAGGHNALLAGPPGTGKTLLARCLPGILPPLSPREALEVTTVYSVAGLLPPELPLIRQRPFRAPHHTVSHAGLVGGGRLPRPGELSLAHRGVLFLDELPEFGAAGLDTLRQPLEDGTVTISRAHGAVTYPARVLLVGAMNPCPCGHAAQRPYRPRRGPQQRALRHGQRQPPERGAVDKRSAPA